ncbi:Metallo-dependent phosphatase-like protein [Crassisporium funariophilum]|nr:Metallo-dependent phosphatase-like protein [Crassisporium funariophilum]
MLSIALSALLFFRVYGGALKEKETPAFPDFSRYEHLDILHAEDFPLNHPARRIIVTGDIHGMIKPFKELLNGLEYNPEHDVLVHVGDILTRGPHAGSLAVLKFMAANNITGVRGNNDQKVLEWRSWQAWITSDAQGRIWLARLHSRWDAVQARGGVEDVRSWVKTERNASRTEDEQWWKKIPQGWRLFGDHYRVARDIAESEFEYLVGLPLRLYVPSAHVFIAHAGMLPSDPRYPFDDDERQPLARLPIPSTRSHDRLFVQDKDDGEGIFLNKRLPRKQDSRKTIEQLRNMQEMQLMTQVPQNQDPWVTLNIRSVVNGSISRKSTKGEPWSERWAREMGLCVGYAQELLNEEDGTADRSQVQGLPCYPATVIYGHAASRALDLKRWSIGLDSGCVYQKRLSALIIGGLDVGEKRYADDAKLVVKDAEASFAFGDRGRASIVSVGCQ